MHALGQPSSQQVHNTAREKLILAFAGESPWRGSWGKRPSSGRGWQMWFEVQPPVPVLAFLWRAEQRVSPHPISVSGHCVGCLPSTVSDENSTVTWHPWICSMEAAHGRRLRLFWRTFPVLHSALPRKCQEKQVLLARSKIAKLSPKPSQSQVPGGEELQVHGYVLADR